jgi:hypothetical protein
MKPGNRQYLLLKWCQFTQSECFGRWEKGLFLMMPFCLCRKAFYFIKNRFVKKVKTYIIVKRYITIEIFQNVT